MKIFEELDKRETSEIEKDFINYIKEKKSDNEEISEAEFEKWENALSDNINHAEQALRKTDYKLETIANSQQKLTLGIPSDKTIEAKAGKFYDQRIKLLTETIDSSNDENTEKDLQYISDFYPRVIRYIERKYSSPEEQIDWFGNYQEVDKAIVSAHNDVIKHLNGLNDLAKKYHVRPFTVRNFLPSDAVLKERQTQAIQDIMQLDRYIVVDYCRTAFPSEFERAEKSYEIKTQLMR